MWIYVIVTGLIAWHGLTYRDKNGEHPLCTYSSGASP